MKDIHYGRDGSVWVIEDDDSIRCWVQPSWYKDGMTIDEIRKAVKITIPEEIIIPTVIEVKQDGDQR